MGADWASLVRKDMHLHHHLQMLSTHAPAQVEQLTVPLGPKDQFALLAIAGDYKAMSLSPKADVQRAACHLSEHVSAGIEVVAPANLMRVLAADWAGKGGRVETLQQEVYMARQQRSTPAVFPPQVQHSSQIPAQRLAEGMAFCWLQTCHQSVPASAFAQLMQASQAWLWVEQGTVRAFQVYTPLAADHHMIGQSCGEGEYLPFLFNRLLHANGHEKPATVCANLNQRNLHAVQRMKDHKFRSFGQPVLTGAFT